MLFLAPGDKFQAVFKARIALDLAISAHLGAFDEMLGVFVLGAGRLPGRGENGNRQHGRHQRKGVKHQ